MGEDNLAKVFGPTLVGYSCPEPQVMQAISETKPQQDVGLFNNRKLLGFFLTFNPSALIMNNNYFRVL